MLTRSYSAIYCCISSEKITKIGQYLSELSKKYKCLVFYGPQCIFDYFMDCSGVLSLDLKLCPENLGNPEEERG